MGIVEPVQMPHILNCIYEIAADGTHGYVPLTEAIQAMQYVKDDPSFPQAYKIGDFWTKARMQNAGYEAAMLNPTHFSEFLRRHNLDQGEAADIHGSLLVDVVTAMNLLVTWKMNIPRLSCGQNVVLGPVRVAIDNHFPLGLISVGERRMLTRKIAEIGMPTNPVPTQSLISNQVARHLNMILCFFNDKVFVENLAAIGLNDATLAAAESFVFIDRRTLPDVIFLPPQPDPIDVKAMPPNGA